MIELVITDRGDVCHDGQVLCMNARQPFISGARALLKRGVAPDETVMIKRASGEYLRARIGNLAAAQGTGGT